MKNKFILILITLTVCMGSMNAFTTENRNLSITIYIAENVHEKTIQYPSGTKYEIWDEFENKAKAIRQEDGLFFEKGDYKILIYPIYKKSPDVYDVENRRLSIIEGNLAGIGEENISHKDQGVVNNYGRYNEVTQLKKIMVKSKLYPNEYNCILTLSNGIEFSYINQNVAATLYNNIIKVKGNYIIESEIGTAKISYKPENGMVWYVFEPKEASVE